MRSTSTARPMALLSVAGMSPSGLASGSVCVPVNVCWVTAQSPAMISFVDRGLGVRKRVEPGHGVLDDRLGPFEAHAAGRCEHGVVGVARA